VVSPSEEGDTKQKHQKISDQILANNLSLSFFLLFLILATDALHNRRKYIATHDFQTLDNQLFLSLSLLHPVTQSFQYGHT
jgi:hypothetical protein